MMGGRTVQFDRGEDSCWQVQGGMTLWTYRCHARVLSEPLERVDFGINLLQLVRHVPTGFVLRQ